MLVALFSDTHDNMDTFTWALGEAERHHVSYGIHCGDIIAGFMAERMAHAPFPFFAVFGNNDGDRERLQDIARQSDGALTFSGTMHGKLVLDERRIFVCHYPEDAHRALKTSNYDAIFYGHTHEKELHYKNNTIICNPGELYGGRTGIVSFALYNTTTHSVEFIIKS